MSFINQVSPNIDNEQLPVVIFMDLWSTASDTLDHKILIDKLQYYVIRKSR